MSPPSSENSKPRSKSANSQSSNSSPRKSKSTSQSSHSSPRRKPKSSGQSSDPKSKSARPSKNSAQSSAATTSTKKSRKAKHSKAKSSSPTSSNRKKHQSEDNDSPRSSNSLPFIPTNYPYNDQTFLGSIEMEATAPEPEDYFNDFSNNFDEPPPPPLIDGYSDYPYPPPPAPFPFGDGDTYQNPPQNATVIDPSQLPSIYPNNYKVGCGGAMCNCSWWKARSILCCKCYETPLCPRPKPKSGGYGYGFIRKTISRNARPGENGEGDHTGGKLVYGLCSKCAAEEEEADCEKICWGGDFSFRSDPKKGIRPFPGSTRRSERDNNKVDLCNCMTSTEYKAKYTNPENQHNIKERHKAGRGRSLKEQRDREIVYLEKLRELMARPPWNFDTRVPPPPFDESLGGVEKKLQNLDEMIMNETRTPQRYRSRRNLKIHPSRSKPRKNVARSRSRNYQTKRPMASPSRATKYSRTRSPGRGAPQPRKHAPTKSKPVPIPQKQPNKPKSSTDDDDSNEDELDDGEGSGSGSGSGSYTTET